MFFGGEFCRHAGHSPSERAATQLIGHPSQRVTTMGEKRRSHCHEQCIAKCVLFSTIGPDMQQVYSIQARDFCVLHGTFEATTCYGVKKRIQGEETDA